MSNREAIDQLLVAVDDPRRPDAMRKALQAAADAFAASLGVLTVPDVEDFSVERPHSTAEARLALTLTEAWNLFARVTRDAEPGSPNRREQMLRVKALLDELTTILEDCRRDRFTWISERLLRHQPPPASTP